MRSETLYSVGMSLLLLSLMACAGGQVTSESSVSAPEPVVVAGGDTDLSGKSGTPMEPFSLDAVDGTPYPIEQHLGKDVLMVTFWATWCGPCKTELGRMDPVYQRLKDRGFVYVAIATDDPSTVGEVRPYVSSYGYEYPILLDTQSNVIHRYNPRGDLPFYILVNRKGEIVEEHQGFNPGDETLIEQKILSLLGDATK